MKFEWCFAGHMYSAIRKHCSSVHLQPCKHLVTIPNPKTNPTWHLAVRTNYGFCTPLPVRPLAHLPPGLFPNLTWFIHPWLVHPFDLPHSPPGLFAHLTWLICPLDLAHSLPGLFAHLTWLFCPLDLVYSPLADSPIWPGSLAPWLVRRSILNIGHLYYNIRQRWIIQHAEAIMSVSKRAREESARPRGE